VLTAERVKSLLQLEPLPGEGGFYRETYRSRWQVSGEVLPDGIKASRSMIARYPAAASMIREYTQ
jgi:predicted cupin superfamily sugar epimerase